MSGEDARPCPEGRLRARAGAGAGDARGVRCLLPPSGGSPGRAAPQRGRQTFPTPSFLPRARSAGAWGSRGPRVAFCTRTNVSFSICPSQPGLCLRTQPLTQTPLAVALLAGRLAQDGHGALSEFLLVARPGGGGFGGTAPQTGLALQLLLFAMLAFSSPCVRRGGHFEVRECTQTRQRCPIL